MTAKKSGTFMVYLKSMKRHVASGGGSSGWGEGEMYAIGLEIRDLFQRVVSSASSPFTTADFTWEGSPAAIRPHELLVYFTERSRSQIANNGGGQPTSAGATFWTSAGMISEVYIDAVDGDADFDSKLAKLAFHELMHNKLDAHPIKATATNIHKSGGAGLALENPGSQDLTPRNIALMAAHLTLEIPQWTGGLLQHF